MYLFQGVRLRGGLRKVALEQRPEGDKEGTLGEGLPARGTGRAKAPRQACV